MNIKRFILHQIIALVLVVLCIPLISVSDCLGCDQIVDSLDHSEWDNHSFILNSQEENKSHSITSLPLEPPFSLIAVAASQVFHPPALV